MSVVMPVLYATALGHVDLLTYLIENLEDTSDINIQDNISATPLHDAAEFGELQTMAVLLKYGADLNIKDNVTAQRRVDNDFYYLCRNKKRHTTWLKKRITKRF